MKKNLFIIFVLIFILSCATLNRKISVVNIKKEEKKIRNKVEKIVKEQKQQKKDIKIVKEKKEYIVKKGDSLWRIAEKIYSNGMLWKKIASINDIKEPYLIFEGEKLNLDLKEKPKVKKRYKYRVLKNKTFGVGEKLVYAVKYFNIVAGTGILEVKDIVKINNRPAYHIVATARTAPFFEVFYRVRDRIESFMDVMGLFSWKYSKHLEEGNYRANAYIEFFPDKKIGKKDNGQTFKIPMYVQDVLSELYYYRTFDLSKGKNDEVYIDVCSDEGKVYQILVKKLKYETVTVDAGTFDCVVVKPFLKYEGIFRQKGDVLIWLTNDEKKIPVLVKSKIVIGTIDAVLQYATIVNKY